MNIYLVFFGLEIRILPLTNYVMKAPLKQTDCSIPVGITMMIFFQFPQMTIVEIPFLMFHCLETLCLLMIAKAAFLPPVV